jgi:hypothetical protein
MGHPNALGAQKYADAISAAASHYVATWLGLKLFAIRIDPLPSLVPGQPSTVTVFAEDRLTRAQVAGNVSIGSSTYRTNEPFTHTFCPAAPVPQPSVLPFPSVGLTPTAAPACDLQLRELQVYAPGYAPTWSSFDPYGTEAPFIAEEIHYILADGQRWRARVVRSAQGFRFEHYLANGAFSHSDDHIAYLTQDGSAWQAMALNQLQGASYLFRHAPSGDWSRAHVSTNMIYLDWDRQAREVWLVERSGVLVFALRAP